MDGEVGRVLIGLIVACVSIALMKVKVIKPWAFAPGILAVGGGWMVITAIPWTSDTIDARNFLGYLLLVVISILVISYRGLVNTILGIVGGIFGVLALLTTWPLSLVEWTVFGDILGSFGDLFGAAADKSTGG